VSAQTDRLPELERTAAAAIESAPTLQVLVEIRARFLGRSGSVSELLRGIGGASAEERRALGQAANATKERIEAWVRARREVLESARLASLVTDQSVDVSLPGVRPRAGHLHPVTHVVRDMVELFTGLGFSVEDGPHVETDWNNFGALNFPADHPARDCHDTFLIEGSTAVLRTHTSPVQIRVMTGRKPPFRFIAPGRVYRRDGDATHSPVFHQLEGFMVDERVTFADLKGVLYAFARHLMGESAKLRFRAHYFPFTEPSAEMDFRFEGRWLEWGGCGMIHPHVLRSCGIDPERYQGFAFGMGIDRTAMLRYGVTHIQMLFDADVRVLEQI
jgi:phenylalanyl-tRNA synthetase alpha chain